MQATNRTRIAALSTALVVLTLIAAATLPPAREASVAAPVTKAGAPIPMVGTFTGEFDNGVPVYRLPAIAVTANRSTAFAKMAREENVAIRSRPLQLRPPRGTGS